MNAREMHYDFKQKLNRIDSQTYRDLVVPEIDKKLNEAKDIFVKIIAQPRFASQIGFEANQRTIDDIRTIVVNQNNKDGECITPVVFDESSYLVALPSQYWFYINASIYASKGSCKNIKLKAREVQSDDEVELSVFDRSSFEWRVSNIRFIDKGIRIFTDGSFTPNNCCLEYIRKPRKIHNAQDFDGGTYTDLDDEVLVGTQSCDLPEMTHSEIVDIAVLITTGDLNLPTYGLKQSKKALTN